MPDETDNYGQLSASSSNGLNLPNEPVAGLSTVMPAGDQQHHHHDPADSNSSDHSHHSHHNYFHHSNHQSSPMKSKSPFFKGSKGATSGATTSLASSAFQSSSYKADLRPNQQQLNANQRKYHENELLELVSPTTGNVVDVYDALSTEATPTKQFNHQQSDYQKLAGKFQLSGGRRFANKTQQQLQQQENAILADNNNENNYANPDPNDLIDDIHTTRSSLANANNQQQQQEIDQQNHHSSLVLHGPYGISPQISAINQLGAQLLMNGQSSRDNNSDMSEDMMTSYSRMPSSNSNLTEALMREYNNGGLVSNQNNQSSTISPSNSHASQLIGSAMLANLIASMPSQSGEQQQSSPTGAANDPYQMQPTTNSQANHHRTSSMPISALLADLLKLARPQQLINSLSAAQSGQQEGKPQHSILQQLRSLPGPLLSLLQGMGPSSASQPNNNDYQNLINHDASESSQHYHRISMSPSDIHSILARSLRSTGVLPAFPPPKGTQQNWIPPTSGGNPNIHNSVNSNADFVASNVAGFVRAIPSSSGVASQQDHQQNSFAAQQQGASQDSNQRISSNDQSAGDQQQSNNEQHTNQNQQPIVFSNNNQQQPASQTSGANLQFPADPRTWTQANANHQPVPAPIYSSQRQELTNLVDLSSMRLRQQQPGNGKPILDANQNGNYPALQASSIGFGGQQQSMSSQGVPSYGAGSQQPKLASEMQAVPLGYNPAAGPMANSFNIASVESSPKITVASMAANLKSMQQQQQQQAINMRPQSHHQQVSQAKTRRKRGISSNKQANENAGRVDEDMSSKYAIGDDEDEDDTDLRPISVLSTDGRPMNSGRINHKLRQHSKEKRRKADHNSHQRDVELNDRQPAQSQRSANHLDFSQSKQAAINNKNSRQQSRGANLEAAGSGLMSRLLGTASTNSDDIDGDEADDDDESAGEKRKEEIEDAEFGIVNDNNNNIDNNRQTTPNLLGTAQQDNSNESGPSRSSDTVSNSADNNEAFPSRRHQQRSDIEFYGHPGEETRQLKYGILGSGNYEVVNGGIYPEADESTAAVNSVANYVRKPTNGGSGGILASLPKLLAEHHHQTKPTNDQSEPGLTNFMPGGRVGHGFMRGASANHPPTEEQLLNLISGPHHPLSKDAHLHHLSNPLLDLIDAGKVGQFHLDPNFLAQLGSSGSSTRTVHADQNEESGGVGGIEIYKSSGGERKQSSASELREHNATDGSGRQSKKAKQTSNSKNNEYDDSLVETSSSIDGNKIRGGKQINNQFNSYQILPSKKVTIFSDQDLDSAPSNSAEESIVGLPRRTW